MLGKSSRFFDAGYDRPKYKLESNGKTIFELVVKSFDKYFASDLFVFILREDFADKIFVSCALEKLGVKNFRIVLCKNDTRGQAESVYLFLDNAPGCEELFIFNIDTILYNFTKQHYSGSAGYLEVAIYRSNLKTVGGASTLLGIGYRDTISIEFS